MQTHEGPKVESIDLNSIRARMTERAITHFNASLAAGKDVKSCIAELTAEIEVFVRMAQRAELNVCAPDLLLQVIKNSRESTANRIRAVVAAKEFLDPKKPGKEDDPEPNPGIFDRVLRQVNQIGKSSEDKQS